MTRHARAVSLALILATLAACPASQQTTAYKTLGAVTDVVYTGMKIYGDEVRAGHISADDQAKVKKAYEVYQGVIGPAIQSRGLTAPVPDDVALAANALLSVLQSLGVVK